MNFSIIFFISASSSSFICLWSFIFSKNLIKIVATDSFRLAEKTVSLESPVKKDISFILPQKPAREIINILGEKEGKIKIYFLLGVVLRFHELDSSENPDFFT